MGPRGGFNKKEGGGKAGAKEEGLTRPYFGP